METFQLGPDGPLSSRLAYGCMRLAGDGSPDARAQGRRAVRAAIDAGYTLFDHADIYGGGAGEEIFGEVLRDSPGLRDGLLIQGKCSVRFAGAPDEDSPQRYDLTAEHIAHSVEGSLARLGIDRLDLLLLHRPDFLMDASEIAAAFESLKASGAVARFGVSNFSTSQVEMLQAVLPDRLLVNQVEINLHRIDALSDGTLDQCQRTGITPQAWCPLGGVAYDAWGNTFTPEDVARLRVELDRQADRYGTADWIVALAWLLRHPAQISPIVGSTTPERIAAAARALELEYTREDWYRLLEARVGRPVP
jgi:predicted oxidoreductase